MKMQTPQLLEGSEPRTLIRLTLPMMIGIIGMVAFNPVDTFFVGRLGTLDLAAMSFTFPVVLVVSSPARGNRVPCFGKKFIPPSAAASPGDQRSCPVLNRKGYCGCPGNAPLSVPLS